MAAIEPERAGAASGAMSTTQQVGYGLGVAITGVIFFAHADIASGFELSLVQLAALAVGIVVATGLLPSEARRTLSPV
jgi:hypothetical protein